jgi:sugar phosphate isomerase/epimerase
MRQSLSLSYLTVTGLAPPEHVAVAAAAGFDSVGLRIVPALDGEEPYPMAVGSAMLERTLSLARDSGVRVLDIELIKLERYADPKVLEGVFQTAAALGAKDVLVTSNQPDEAMNAHRLAALCQFGARFGLHFNVEFMPWAAGVRTLEQAERLVRACGESNAHIMVDAIHFARTGATFEYLRELPSARFRYVQLCDAPAEAPATEAGILEQGRFERLFPGEGGLPLRLLLDSLPARIPISVEAPKRARCAEVGYREFSIQSIAATKLFLSRRHA